MYFQLKSSVFTEVELLIDDKLNGKAMPKKKGGFGAMSPKNLLDSAKGAAAGGLEAAKKAAEDAAKAKAEEMKQRAMDKVED